MASSEVWNDFTGVYDEKIINCRKQYHKIIQYIAAVGRSYLPFNASDQNAVLHYIPKLERLAGLWITGNVTFRTSIGLREFALYLVNEKLESYNELPLTGKVGHEVFVWLETQILRHELTSSHLHVKLPYQLPDYAQDNSVIFSEIDSETLEKFQRLYANSCFIMERYISENLSFGSIDIWPHHFDLYCKKILRNTGNDQTNSFVAFGMSPGDSYYELPYFFVNSWPYAEESDLSDLKTGHWHTQEWIGAVLPINDLMTSLSQLQTLENFYQKSMEVLTISLMK